MLSESDLSTFGIAELIKSFIESLNLSEPPTLVASDSGGAITQILISKYPNLASRLIFCNVDCLECFPPKQLAFLPWAYRNVPYYPQIAAKLYKTSFVLNTLMGMAIKHPKNIDPELVKN